MHATLHSRVGPVRFDCRRCFRGPSHAWFCSYIEVKRALSKTSLARLTVSNELGAYYPHAAAHGAPPHSSYSRDVYRAPLRMTAPSHLMSSVASVPHTPSMPLPMPLPLHFAPPSGSNLDSGAVDPALLELVKYQSVERRQQEQKIQELDQQLQRHVCLLFSAFHDAFG